MKTITTNVPHGIVVREFDIATGFERAWRKRDDSPLVSRSYGHKGPWLLVPIEQVPAEIWLKLTRQRPA